MENMHTQNTLIHIIRILALSNNEIIRISVLNLFKW